MSCFDFAELCICVQNKRHRTSGHKPGARFFISGAGASALADDDAPAIAHQIPPNADRQHIGTSCSIVVLSLAKALHSVCVESALKIVYSMRHVQNFQNLSVISFLISIWKCRTFWSVVWSMRFYTIIALTYTCSFVHYLIFRQICDFVYSHSLIHFSVCLLLL